MIRYNPNKKDFDLSDVINEINKFIHSKQTTETKVIRIF